MVELKGLNIGFLGGDRREIILMQYLQKQGANIHTLGFPPAGVTAKATHQLEDFLATVEIAIGPMPGTDVAGYIKGAYLPRGLKIDEEFFKKLGPNKPLLIGMLPAKLVNIAHDLGSNIILSANLDEIAILNAIPTAEGAVQIALAESERTIFGSKSIVLGLGRVGRVLGHRLALLGSKVYGVTRNPAAHAWGQDIGIVPATYASLETILPQAHFIFNTVPAMVLTDDVLKECYAETIIIDLASAPGGVDFDSAKKLGIKALLCLGLPGKLFPQSAGEILCRTYPRLIFAALAESKKK